MDKKIILFIFSVVVSCYATESGQICSVSGKIEFDCDNDQGSEMTLNHIGLGIGAQSSNANLHVAGNVIVSDRLSIGSLSGSSNLNIHGSISFTTLDISSDIELSESSSSHVVVDTSLGNIHVELPYAANVIGRMFRIKKSSVDHKLFITGGGNDIDNYGIVELASGERASMSVISDGHRWWVTSTHKTLSTVGSDNLVGWWTFSEKNGTVVHDSSGSGLNGDLNGGLSFSFNSASSHLGRCLVFYDGSGEVRVTNATPLMTPDLSIAVWLKSGNNTSMVERFISLEGDSGGPHGNYFLRYETDNRFGFWAYNSTLPYDIWYPRAKSTTIAHEGESYHVVSTFDGEKMRLYINGSLEHSEPRSHPISYGSGANLIIKSRPGGHIDDIRIYNRALTTAEIELLYESVR